MPWEVYERPRGYRDLVFAMASLESELVAELEKHGYDWIKEEVHSGK